MRIQRDKLREAFTAFPETASGIIVGAPGVGKTFHLKQFSENRTERPALCLYLPIDKLGVENESDLEAALGIKSDFIEYLHRQTGSSLGPGILVVDAFDAARSEDAQRFFLGLIRRVVNNFKGQWNVVVSVRTYDAMKSLELQDIFPQRTGTNVPYEYQMSGIYCRHFAIPPLSDEERAQAVSSVAHLPEIYANSSQDFQELLRIPFNLWLVERLLSLNPELPELSAVVSEIQLLGLFWKYRVAGGRSSEDRRALLSKVTREMVAVRALSVRRDEVYTIGAGDTWDSVMNAEVLVYTSETEQRVTFRHNILFDYAVSVLLIEDDADRLIDFLSEDPSRPLFLRPSLNFYFTRLWHGAPALFWRIFWRMLLNTDLHVRLFARLLPPTVVVNEVRKIEELDPLMDGLMNGEAVAKEAVLRVLQAHSMLDNGRIVTLVLVTWTHFLMKISSHLQREFVGDVAAATNNVLELARKQKIEDLEKACGFIARNLLQWVWQQRATYQEPWFENLGSVWAVPLVAKTFGTSPNESELLLSKVFELLQEPDYPINYFYRLADEVDEIWPYSPEFVSSVYQIVFGHQEVSEARTHMGGIILPLTSTRRQDFDMCRYILITKYPNFLEAEPLVASYTGIHCLNRVVIDEHVRKYSEKGVDAEELAEQFSFRGGVARYLPDGSYAWDQSYIDETLKMADSLFSFINKAAVTEAALDKLDFILDEFRDSVLVAFFWKRLLELGSRTADVFAPRLFELCIARPILLGNETLQEVGSFIEAAAPFFEDEQLLQIEQTIMALAGDGSDEDAEYLVRRRNRLIARIPTELLQTEQAISLRQQMEEAQNIPTNEPLFTINMGWSSYTEDMWLKEQGVNPEHHENQALLSVTAPLDAFTSKWQNGVPSADEVRAVLPMAREAYLVVREPSGADEAVIQTALTKIAACANSMSRGVVDPGSAEFQFCREVLLTCADHPSPQPDPSVDANYSHPSWSPAPRTEAAQGLSWLALRAPDADLLAAIERLINDPKPSVRFLTVTGLFRLIEKSPDIFWRLAEHIAEIEQNKVVLDALSRTLSYVAMRDEQRTVQVLDRFIKRNMAVDSDLKVLENAIPTVVGLALARRNEWAFQTLDVFSGNPVVWAKTLRRCVFNALTFITPGRLDDPKNLPTTENAVAWLSRVINVTTWGIKELLEEGSERGWDEASQQKLRDVYGIIDEVVMRLYFAGKVKDDMQLHSDDEATTHEQRRKYYFTIKPLLEQVLAFTRSKENGLMFAPTAHYFMKLLNGVLQYDPRGVLHLATGVAESSEPRGYNLDPMAVKEVVRLVEVVLADFRYEVNDGQPLQDLMSLLDIFAKTGSAEALRLVWRLDEIFR
ncbi:MAG TPA: hypothetical protein VEY11_00300 [Pyrinomonadaceae bacterium]|nr:hypothetical protein [Pyrinomonadaceae bacterium]